LTRGRKKGGTAAVLINVLGGKHLAVTDRLRIARPGRGKTVPKKGPNLDKDEAGLGGGTFPTNGCSTLRLVKGVREPVIQRSKKTKGRRKRDGYTQCSSQ